MNEFILLNKNNKKINIIEGIHINKIKTIIVHIHGMGSHFQPYFQCIDEFKDKDLLFSNFNYKSFALEFHGHGKSEGNRCSINSFDDLLDDLDLLINHIKIKYEQPIFLMAESMGCAVALKYCIIKNNNIKIKNNNIKIKNNNIKGIILSAPLFGIDDNLKPNYLVTLILTIFSYFIPEMPLLSNNLSLIAVKNDDFIKAKDNNKYSYKGNHKLNTCREMVKISDWIDNNGYLLETPILVFHGLKDTITNPLITKKIFDKMISKDKELHLIKDGYHCLLIESEDNPYLPGYIIGKMINWINERTFFN